MRDEERIQAYYIYGTIDYKSELAEKKKGGKRTYTFRVLRPLKLAAIIWVEAVKNLSLSRR